MFAATWMELEMIILGEVRQRKSDRERQISQDITYMQNLKKNKYKEGGSRGKGHIYIYG